MLLTEFFNQSEGDSYAEPAPTSRVTETKRKITAKNDLCWKGYHMVGTKNKDNQQVSNCMPGTKSTMNEGNEMSHIVQARQLVNQAMRDPNTRNKYFEFLKHLRNMHGKEYSTRIHQDATKL